MPNDFDDNNRVAIKYGVYTLVCEQLLTHLKEFAPLLHGQSDLSMEDIRARTDQVLRDILLQARVGGLCPAQFRLERGGFGFSPSRRPSRAPPETLAEFLDSGLQHLRPAGKHSICFFFSAERGLGGCQLLP